MHPLLLALALAAASPRPPSPIGPTDDVLVVVLDDVGKDLLAAYGGPEPARTPNLDALAAVGRVYDRAYANPLCAPSRSCVVTGRYGFRTGFGTNHRQGAAYEVAAAEQCVPELLAGAETPPPSVQWFNKWHLCNSDGDDFTDRHAVEACGFERFVGHPSNLNTERLLAHTDHYRWRRVRATPASTDVTVVDGYATSDWSEATWVTSVCKDELVAALNGLDPARRAVFFWAPVAPHGPFQSPPPTLVSPETAASVLPPPAEAPEGEERPYSLAAIEAVDTLLGELLAELDPARRARLTVLVTADNGTSRKVLHPSLDPTHAKGTLYEGGIAVPLIVAGPTVASPGTRDASLVHLVDIAATIGELIGVTTPPAEDSVSFYPTFAADQPGARTYAFSERFESNGAAPPCSTRAVVGPRYKLIRRTDTGPDGDVVVDELYDLVTDASESADLLGGQLTADELQAYTGLSDTLDALLAPAADVFCAGDDVVLCPCENEGAPETGCDLAQGTGGIDLRVARQETAPFNRATLVARGYPNGAFVPSVVLRSSALEPGAPPVFGDGLRCLASPLVRLGASLSVDGTSVHKFGHGSMSGAVGAGTFHYQLWLRNMPPSFCDGASAFNLSSGRSLNW